MTDQTISIRMDKPLTVNRRQFMGVMTGATAGLTFYGLDSHVRASPPAKPPGSMSLEDQMSSLEGNEAVEDIRRAREALASDPYRPLYHFSPPDGLTNDPNGVCQWQGRYHLFYQWYPFGAKVVHWGHAYSEDMLNWVDLPIAISPTIEQSCFSGQTLVEPDRVIAMWHGTRVGNMIATASDPLLLNWEHHPENPVIPIVPTDGNGMPYRVFDPEIWKEGDTYYSLSGTYQNGRRGGNAEMAVHLFRSKDLAKWEHLGTLIEGTQWTDPGEDGAVPNFIPMGNGKHILMFFSHKHAAQYLIGTYDRNTHKFHPEQHGRLSFGTYLCGSLHAPSAHLDDRGDLIAYFNMREARTSVQSVIREHKPGAWYGIMTLPRRYRLDEQNVMRVEPAPDTSSLRFNHQQVRELQLAADHEVALESIAGKAIEIDAVFDPGNADSFGLHVLQSPDGQERTTVRVEMPLEDHGQAQVGIDVSRASLHDDVRACAPAMAPVPLPTGEPVRLRVFVDRSIVEVYINDIACVSYRTYPKREDSRNVSVFANGGDASLLSLNVWQMRSVWPELKDKEGQ